MSPRPAENLCRPPQERIGFLYELVPSERAPIEEQVRLRQLSTCVIFPASVPDQTRREDIDGLPAFNFAGDWPQHIWAKTEVDVYCAVVDELVSVGLHEITDGSLGVGRAGWVVGHGARPYIASRRQVRKERTFFLGELSKGNNRSLHHPPSCAKRLIFQPPLHPTAQMAAGKANRFLAGPQRRLPQSVVRPKRRSARRARL